MVRVMRELAALDRNSAILPATVLLIGTPAKEVATPLPMLVERHTLDISIKPPGAKSAPPMWKASGEMGRPVVSTSAAAGLASGTSDAAAGGVGAAAGAGAGALWAATRRSSSFCWASRAFCWASSAWRCWSSCTCWAAIWARSLATSSDWADPCARHKAGSSTASDKSEVTFLTRFMNSPGFGGEPDPIQRTVTLSSIETLEGRVQHLQTFLSLINGGF